MATNPKDIRLTDEQRALIAKRAEETGRPWSVVLEEFFLKLQEPPKRGRPAGRSLYDVLSDRGLIGAMEGPGDLSTSPQHMEGFGESRGSDSD